MNVRNKVVNKLSISFNYRDYTGNASDIKKDTLNITVRHPPKKGQFKLENVLESVYFFS